MKKHPHKRIVIKHADIDTVMIPVVKWLNGFDSIWTKHCCQGEPDSVADHPYVVFGCDEFKDLMAVVARTAYYGIVEIRPYLGIRLVDYAVTFHDRERLDNFIADLKRGHRLEIFMGASS